MLTFRKRTNKDLNEKTEQNNSLKSEHIETLTSAHSKKISYPLRRINPQELSAYPSHQNPAELQVPPLLMQSVYLIIH